MNARYATAAATLIVGGALACAVVAIEEVRDHAKNRMAEPVRPPPTTARPSTLAAPSHPTSPPAPPRYDEPPALELPPPERGVPVVVPILMYHRIDAHSPGLPEITQRLTVLPGAFARQMTWLHDHGYHTITQRELFDALTHRESLDARPVLVTFDDGYRDVFGQASEVILRLGLHATAYVITGRISGPDGSFLTWPLLRSLERRGIEIGSHTVTHADLTQLTDAALADELRTSREALERGLGHPVQWLAYPYGRSDARVVDAAREAGYVLAVTTAGSRTQLPECALELRRLRILDTTTLADFEWLLTAPPEPRTRC